MSHLNCRFSPTGKHSKYCQGWTEFEFQLVVIAEGLWRYFWVLKLLDTGAFHFLSLGLSLYSCKMGMTPWSEEACWLRARQHWFPWQSLHDATGLHYE